MPRLANSSALMITLLLLALPGPGALAQSYCASDGVRQPKALQETFISADCAQCWSAEPALAATPSQSQKAATALRLDWIVPTAQGEEAPLAAAATRDALARLDTLALAPPALPNDVAMHLARLKSGAPQTLRVAHGLALNDYLGASIAYRAPPGWRDQELSAWLLLVESIPAGSDGTPVARNLVRNTLQLQWQASAANGKTAARTTPRWQESRPMRIPDGARPERLRLVGWVQDAKGQVIALAESRCRPATVQN